MTFALWWALTYSQSRFWPLVGVSQLGPNSHLWMQTSSAHEGVRAQLTAGQGPWTLRYGSHSLGWGWSIARKGHGIWWSPKHGLGVLSSGRSVRDGRRASFSIAAHQRHFVGRLQWNTITLQQSLGGATSISAKLGPGTFDASVRKDAVQVGLRGQRLDLRWAQSSAQQLALIRLHNRTSSLELRRRIGSFGAANQLTLSTKGRSYQFWLHGEFLDQRTQLSLRTWIQTERYGQWSLFWESNQSTFRWSPGTSSRWDGSYVQLGTPIGVRLAFQGFSLTGEWSREHGLGQLSLASRIPIKWRKATPFQEPTEVMPTWLDVHVEYRGELPETHLEFSGTSTHVIKILPQSRQWSDRIPPGRYAVRGRTARGWTVDLGSDSITLASGQISPVSVRITRPNGMIHWVNAPSAAGESNTP